VFNNSGTNLSDLYNFSYVMERYNSFGIKMHEAVENYLKTVQKPALRKIMETLLRDLRNGIAFPDALSKHPSFFPAFVIAMMRIGQDSGQTGKIWEDITSYLEQEIEIGKDIRSAMWIQKVFFAFFLVAAVIIIFLVIPKMGDLLKETDMELPMVTKAVIGFGTIATSFWWLFLLAGIGCVLGYGYFKREYPEQYDALKLKVPVFSTITYDQLQYRFARVFGLCRQAGLDPVSSLRYAAIAADNLIMKNMLQKAASSLENSGLPLREALMKADVHHILHPDFFLMMQVGIAGDISEVMLKEADKYQKEMRRSAKTIGDKVGLCVMIPGYVVMILLFASMELPIMSMMQNMNLSGGGM